MRIPPRTPDDQDARYQQREHEDERRDGADRADPAHAQPHGRHGSPVEPIKPASTSPMKRMNSPMPAVMASLKGIGTASKIEPAQPGRPPEAR